jgi:uncharacterized protein
MTILIDFQHPAHLHVFKNLIRRLRSEGHRVVLTGRDKDILVELAARSGLEVEFFGRARRGVFHLGLEYLYRMGKLCCILRRDRPELILAVAGTFVSLPGRLFGIPVYIFYDTENATISNLLAYPFASRIIVPACYRKPIRWRHQRYNGYHELAYLHPAHFTPDPGVLTDLKLRADERFTLLRFVSWASGHDIGQSGLSDTDKIHIVRRLEKFGRVLISSESPLPAELEANRLQLDVSRIHSLIAYAALTFGESATMASEAANLGVPAVYLDPIGRGYTDELQRDYGIVFNFYHPQLPAAIAQAEAILLDWPQAKEKWRAIRRRIVTEKVDVTGMMHDLVAERVAQLASRH